MFIDKIFQEIDLDLWIKIIVKMSRIAVSSSLYFTVISWRNLYYEISYL